MTKILIVEDEPDMRRGLEDNLQFEGYTTVSTSNGLEGLRLARQDKFDLIILDLMLPGMDGLDLCRQLKREGSSTPIIMLTAKGSESDRVMGLEVGADDYITKPFSLRELLARVKAILRRSGALSSLSEFQFDDIYLHFGRYEATKGGEPLQLSPREFEIMRLLSERRGEIVTRERFLEEVWGYESAPSTRTVDNHIAKLRQKIEVDPDNPKHIVTVHRMGYKFVP
ncbi:MAG TPA: response regulator transcription factor [bacterium]|nr:response regulator transcription factor [bacterium]HPO09074.1 response regulator transcription factor [bacterium]